MRFNSGLKILLLLKRNQRPPTINENKIPPTKKNHYSPIPTRKNMYFATKIFDIEI